MNDAQENFVKDYRHGVYQVRMFRFGGSENERR